STVARSPLSRGRAEGMNRSSAVRAARRLERCSVDCGPGALMAFSPVVRAARMRQGWVELPTGNDSGDYPTRVHVPWPGRTVEKLFPIKWIGQEITDRTRAACIAARSPRPAADAEPPSSADEIASGRRSAFR